MIQIGPSQSSIPAHQAIGRRTRRKSHSSQSIQRKGKSAIGGELGMGGGREREGWRVLPAHQTLPAASTGLAVSSYSNLFLRFVHPFFSFTQFISSNIRRVRWSEEGGNILAPIHPPPFPGQSSPITLPLPSTPPPHQPLAISFLPPPPSLVLLHPISPHPLR